MSVTAAQLQKTGARGGGFDICVREQLAMIDDRLLQADRHWGLNIVAYELPQNIAIPGLEPKDVQRIVYSSIIKSYKERAFDVEILLEPGRAYMLYLSWSTDLGAEEINAMNTVIAGARIAPGQLDDFLARASGSGSLGSAGGGVPPGQRKKAPGAAANAAVKTPPARVPADAYLGAISGLP